MMCTNLWVNDVLEPVTYAPSTPGHARLKAPCVFPPALPPVSVSLARGEAVHPVEKPANGLASGIPRGPVELQHKPHGRGAYPGGLGQDVRGSAREAIPVPSPGLGSCCVGHHLIKRVIASPSILLCVIKPI